MTEFYEDLANAVALRAEGNSAFHFQAFGDELANRLEIAEVVFDVTVEPLQCIGRNRKALGLLGYAEDGADDSLVIIVGNYFGEEGRTLTLTDAKRTFSAAEGFLEQSVDGWLLENLEISSREAAHAQYFQKQVERAQRLKFILLTDGMMSDRIKSIPSGIVCGLTASYAIWDIRRFEDLASSESGLDEFTIDLTKWLPAGLPCLIGAESQSHARSYLAVLPGQLLADVFAEYGSQLLESNVRTFLSTRGKVNRGIQGTLANQPDMFLAFNNGLTTTATGVDLRQTASGPVLHSLDNWQIVNGGQTTSSLAYFLRQGGGKRSLDGVFVPMKLVTLSAEQAPILVSQISRYANSQNSVSEADLFSNSPFHVRLEQISRRLLAPAREGEQIQTKWFYERARGQYENTRNALTAAAQKRFDLEFPKSQKITKTDWAKFAFSWAQRPNDVSKGAQSNFMAYANVAADLWDKDPDQIGDPYFRANIGKAILHNELRAAVQKSEWYTTGYLANIVAYGISKFAFEIARQFGNRKLDFEVLWRNQRVPEPLLAALLESARVMQGVLTSENRPQANVTQWAKQPACWETAKRAHLSLPAHLEDYFVGAEEARSRDRAAKEERRVDSGLEATSRVMKVKKEVWSEVKRDGVRLGLISPTDLDLIALVERGRSIPSDRQATRLVAILERCAGAGLVSPDDF